MTRQNARAVLAYVFRKATKMDVEEYAARHLFTPLGIDRWFWKRSRSGLADTEGGLYLEARDLAKIWYLSWGTGCGMAGTAAWAGDSASRWSNRRPVTRKRDGNT